MRTRITQLKVEGFRAIRRPLSLKLTDLAGQPLSRVILAGTNGSGKTSLLEAILLALGRENLIVRDLPAAVRGDHWRVEVPEGATITVTLVKGNGAPFTVIRSISDWEIHEADGRWFNDTDAVIERLSTVSIEYFSSWRAPILPGGLQPTTLGRPLADNEANRLRRLKQRIINERARGAIARRTSEAAGAGKDVAWLERLNRVWSEFHADGSTIDADIVDPDADDPQFDLFVFDGNTRRCSIDQVSSGELEIVTIAGTLLLDAFDGILLIDEPELHLHREWQTALLDALRAMAPDSQHIIATHADAPWDQVMTFERFFLAPAGDPRAGAGGT